MFRKISSAAAYFSSPFTRPPKPAPFYSRNSTSLLLLQMFRKISSAAVDAHSFSSLASPPNGKLSSLNSRNSTSLFTCAENSHDEPKIEVSTARLEKGLQTNCKAGDLTADEAFGYFNRLVQMEPRFGLYRDDVLTPNFSTLNVLLKSSCNANRVSDAFLVMGRILRKGYSPTIATFNSLIKGLCMGSRVDDAVQLYLTLKKFGCRPNGTTWRNLNRGLRLCGLGSTSNALKFHEENVIGNGQRCQSDDVSYTCFIIDGYCKSGKEYDALKMFLEMQGSGFRLDVRVYNSLMNGFCGAGEWDVAELLLDDMLDRKIPFDGKTFYVVIDIFCHIGFREHLKCFLNWMIEEGIDLRSEPVNIYED